MGMYGHVQVILVVGYMMIHADDCGCNMIQFEQETAAMLLSKSNTQETTNMLVIFTLFESLFWDVLTHLHNWKLGLGYAD